MLISKDVNGNKVLKVESKDLVNKSSKGFSIQTNGNLPLTHRDGIFEGTMIELKGYIVDFGTQGQKEKLGLTARKISKEELKSMESQANKYGYWAACDSQKKESPFEKDSEAAKEWIEGYELAVKEFEITDLPN